MGSRRISSSAALAPGYRRSALPVVGILGSPRFDWPGTIRKSLQYTGNGANFSFTQSASPIHDDELIAAQGKLLVEADLFTPPHPCHTVDAAQSRSGEPLRQHRTAQLGGRPDSCHTRAQVPLTELQKGSGRCRIEREIASKLRDRQTGGASTRRFPRRRRRARITFRQACRARVRWGTAGSLSS